MYCCCALERAAPRITDKLVSRDGAAVARDSLPAAADEAAIHPGTAWPLAHRHAAAVHPAAAAYNAQSCTWHMQQANEPLDGRTKAASANNVMLAGNTNANGYM